MSYKEIADRNQAKRELITHREFNAGHYIDVALQRLSGAQDDLHRALTFLQGTEEEEMFSALAMIEGTTARLREKFKSHIRAYNSNKGHKNLIVETIDDDSE